MFQIQGFHPGGVGGPDFAKSDCTARLPVIILKLKYSCELMMHQKNIFDMIWQFVTGLKFLLKDLREIMVDTQQASTRIQVGSWLLDEY